MAAGAFALGFAGWWLGMRLRQSSTTARTELSMTGVSFISFARFAAGVANESDHGSFTLSACMTERTSSRAKLGQSDIMRMLRAFLAATLANEFDEWRSIVATGQRTAATLCDHILRIVFRCPYKKMSRIYASTIVATVKNPTSFWDRAIMNLVRYPMSRKQYSVAKNMAIAMSRNGTFPIPTDLIGSLINHRPKSVSNRLAASTRALLSSYRTSKLFGATFTDKHSRTIAYII